MSAKSAVGSAVTPHEPQSDITPPPKAGEETDYGFFLKLKSSAGETIIKIKSMKEFKAGNESLTSDKTISISGSKLKEVLEENKIQLPPSVFTRLAESTSLNLPAFFYNTGGVNPDGTPTPEKRSFFFAIELTFDQDGKDKDGGFLTALTGVNDLGKILDIEAVGVAVYKGDKAADAKKKFFASVEQPAQLPAGTTGNGSKG